MRLWSLASRIYHEALFRGQLGAAGSSQARLIERLGDNSSYLRRQARLVQIMGSFYLGTVTILSMVSAIHLRLGMNHEWNLLVSAAAGGMQTVVQMSYLLLITLLATGEILSPEIYQWLSTLPFPNRTGGTLRILTLAREFLAPLIVVIVVGTVGVGIAGASFAAAGVTLLFGFVHATAAVSAIVLIAWWMRNRVMRHADQTRSARIRRVATVISLAVGTLVVIYAVQIGTNSLVHLYDSPRAGIDARTVTRVVALLPLPFAPAMLSSQLVLAGVGVPWMVPPWMILTGCVLYTALAGALVTRARALLARSAETSSGKPAPVGIAEARHLDRLAGIHFSRSESHGTATTRLLYRSPRAAFRRLIARGLFRDTQAVITVIGPVILPVLMVLGMTSGGGVRWPKWMMITGLGAVTGGWLTIHGFTRLAFGNGALESSLPVRERDRALPRIVLAAAAPTLGSLIALLALLPFGSGEQHAALAVVMSTPPAVVIAFAVKAALFGWMGEPGRPLVIDEVATTARFWRWLMVIATLILITAGAIALCAVVVPQGAAGAGIYAGCVAALYLLSFWILRRAFP
jgi:hypothetical protein